MQHLQASSSARRTARIKLYLAAGCVVCATAFTLVAAFMENAGAVLHGARGALILSFIGLRGAALDSNLC
jgi:hypothetical protein